MAFAREVSVIMMKARLHCRLLPVPLSGRLSARVRELIRWRERSACPLPHARETKRLQKRKDVRKSALLHQDLKSCCTFLCVQALRERHMPRAWGSSGSCFGVPDPEHSAPTPWEPICEEVSGGITYQAWRRPMRKGFFLYRTRAVIEGVTPSDVRSFHMDDSNR